MMYMIFVFMLRIVWEWTGDVLHGLGEVRGWTSKPVTVWEKIGDGLR